MYVCEMRHGLASDDYRLQQQQNLRGFLHKSETNATIFPLISYYTCMQYTGTGKGYSVLEMIAAMERASGKKLNYVLGERRPGDLDEVYSEPTKVSECELLPDGMTD